MTASKLTLPMPAEGLLPHRKPMRFVDELVAAGEGAGVARATVTADNPLLGTDGELAEVGLVELVAQAYAALRGYDDRRQGRPVKRGFLVGVRSFRLHGAARIGESVEIRLQTTAELEGFSLVAGEVRCGEELLAEGSIKLWISPDPAEEDA